MKRFFKALWAGWKKFAHVLGVFNTKVLLTLTYFTMVAFLGTAAWILRRDLLDTRIVKGASFWKDHEPIGDSLQVAKRQF